MKPPDGSSAPPTRRACGRCSQMTLRGCPPPQPPSVETSPSRRPYIPSPRGALLGRGSTGRPSTRPDPLPTPCPLLHFAEHGHAASSEATAHHQQGQLPASHAATSSSIKNGLGWNEQRSRTLFPFPGHQEGLAHISHRGSSPPSGLAARLALRHFAAGVHGRVALWPGVSHMRHAATMN